MNQETMPRWQLESIYPTDDPTAYEADAEHVRVVLDGLERFMAEHHIGGASDGNDADATKGANGNSPTAERDGAKRTPAETAGVLIGLLDRIEDAYCTFVTMNGYLHNRLAVDASDASARALRGALEHTRVQLQTLQTRVTEFIGTTDVDALIALAPKLADKAHMLRRAAHEAKHLMSYEAESLAAALDLPGGTGWEQLHSDLVSTETVTVALEPGESERPYGVAELFIKAADPRENVRSAAMDAELALLTRHRTAYAASMNGIKGQVTELSSRRGWASPLDASLFESGIDRASLEAMQTACVERFIDLRRYLAAKARALGKERLAWYDLHAPVPGASDRSFTWEEAKSFVSDRFATFSPALAGLAKRAFDEGWVDVEPRAGKRNGAFCSSSFNRQESRVMLNFGGRLDDVFTIAHELGHAYHNDCMYRAGRTLLQADSPMTLAETASIFCETLVLDAMLEQADEAEQLAILEQDLQSATGLVVDIHSRFLFESAVFEARRERPLSADELDALMLDAQAATYGEGAGAELRHPLMWAQKPHYYSSSLSFYNYPYTFGYLFGLGLFALYREDKDAFVARYDALLASTGMAAPAELAAGFGIDIRDPAFWRAGLRVCAERVDRFEALVERQLDKMTT